LLNDSKYGYDALENELRLSILRSPIYAFHKPRQMVPGVTYHYVDQGEQVVRYRLFPHRGNWQSVNPDRRSAELHEPLQVQLAAPQAGEWQEGSLLRVEPEHVVLTTLKMSEQGDQLIARGHETMGRPAELTLTSDALGRSWRCSIAPHEIWTLALPLSGGQPQALNLLEEPLH
jgi:alpha-mannosidase